MIGTAEKIAQTLNLTDGILHIQYRIKNNTVYIIEVMRRTLGNMYGVPAEKLCGINFDYWETRARCGMNLNDFPKTLLSCEKFSAYRAIMANRNGAVKNIFVPDEFNKYIFDKFILWNPKTQIKNYLSEPLGFLFFSFDSEDILNSVLLDHYDKIYVT
jgi:hypothetical protein